MTFGRKAVLAIAILVTGAACLTTQKTSSLDCPNGLDRMNQLVRYALPAGERVRFEARVLERIEAGSYVYLGVERESGERSWVVTLSSSSGARRGVDKVRVVAMGYAEHFESKRLSRSFDGLFFAVVRPA